MQQILFFLFFALPIYHCNTLLIAMCVRVCCCQEEDVTEMTRIQLLGIMGYTSALVLLIYIVTVIVDFNTYIPYIIQYHALTNPLFVKTGTVPYGIIVSFLCNGAVGSCIIVKLTIISIYPL